MLRFLGIGAQKAGTTWLYERLRRHPEIAFPRGKEVHFWDRFGAGSSVAEYLSWFCAEELCEGDITPAYGIVDSDTVARIHDAIPNARLIFIMRNPLERAWSSALMALTRAEMTIDEASEQWFIDHFRSRGSRMRGDYAACIANWRSRFSAEQLLLLRFEEVDTAPAEVLRRCCAHLQVQAPVAEMLEDAGRRAFAGPGHALPTSLHTLLRRQYEPRVAELEDLLGVDFSAWLKPPTESDVSRMVV